MEFLPANKADVNAKDEEGRTPLIVTAGRGRIEGTVTSFTIGPNSLL